MNNILHNIKPNSEIELDKRRLLCPSCGKHTLLWLLPDTEIKNLPVKCKRCGKEIIINVEPINFTVAKVDSIP